ncbi:endonuclease Q family protein [Nanoarchaeota archaeon]
MEVIADLHIHSKYARATSRNLSFENLEKYGRIKGISLMGTGDFQHPLHRKEIDENLKEDGNGILRTKTGYPFIWQTEISFMYTQGDKGRAIHLVILAPNTKTADKITEYFGNKGRLDYDGRPIFGISVKEVVKDLKEINDMIEIIPAHCMTPWFGLFGSKKGFDSLEECFEDQVKHVYAVESGMSADPAMLWRFKEKVNVVSFSDAHSFWPWRIGREATIFDISELSYENIIKAIRTGEGLKSTIETPPEYGKYHWDGHRKCDFSCSPGETKRLKGLCPKCSQPLILGVDYRVEEIAKEQIGYKPGDANPFYKLLPLHEVLALHLGVGLSSVKCWTLYNILIKKFENEFNILLKLSREELLQKEVDQKLVALILRNRVAKINVKPGYDGVYGEAQMGEHQETLV